MPRADGENREMPLVFLTGHLVRLYNRSTLLPGNFIEAVSFNKDGSLTEYYIRERDYQQFESQMDSRRATDYENEYHRSAIPQQLVDKAVYKRIYPSPSGPGRITVHWRKLFQFLIYVIFIICIVVAANANLIRDRLIVTICKSSPGYESSVTNHDGDALYFLEVAMTNVFEMIYNILYLSYSFTTSICREILLLFHWMLQSTFHFILSTITASLTFVNDNFPFKITGFIIFLVTGLGYLPMIYWMGKLLKTNAHLKQEEEKLIFEKKKNCANLNEIEKLNLELKKKDNANLKEIEKLKLKLKENDNLILTLRDNILNLNSQKGKLKLQLQEKDKLNSKLGIQNKDLQFKIEKKTKQNVVLKTEKGTWKSEQQDKSLKLKKAKELNVMLEGTGSQLESQNQKLKLELELEKDQRLCDVCADNYKNMLLLPCKHFSLCKTCLSHEKWFKCPICRQDIESTIDVYS